MVKIKFFIFVLLLIPVLAGAQVQDDIQTPKLIPPSPDAAALGKYGAIPVDKSTGIPSISVPLYEIKTPRFSIPISLSYHASGIKVEEISSWVGAGWSLNAGGVITRTVVGFPDDGGFGFLTDHALIKHAADIVWPDDVQYISDVVTKVLDTEPDNFFYNFNGHTGAFAFGDDTKPVLIPYEPVKINFDAASKNFSVIDEGGNTYTFSTKENVTSSLADMSCVSSWYLTQMVSADFTDTVTFQYSTDASPTTEVSFNFSQAMNNWNVAGTYSLAPMVKTSSSRQYNAVRISSIVFKGGKVDFIAQGGRLDDGVMSLDSVIVSNYNGATGQYSRLKTFKLQTDYWYSTLAYPSNVIIGESDKYRLKLAGLTENDGNNTPVKTWQFDYNSGMLPHVHSFGQDTWGYFNGQVMNQCLLQSRSITIANGGTTYVDTVGKSQGADRSVSAADMQAGVLQKITYPTKGYTLFSYDCNKVVEAGTAPGSANSTAVSFYQKNDTVSYAPTNYALFSGGNIFHVELTAANISPGYPPPYVLVVQNGPESRQVIDSIGAYPTRGLDTMVTLNLTAGYEYQLISYANGTNNHDSIPGYAIIVTNYQTQTSSLSNIGGLRVTAISNYNPDGSLVSEETYEYGNSDNSGGGIQLAFPTIDHFSHLTNYFYVGDQSIGEAFTSGVATTYSNNSYYPLSSLNGSPVAYPTVTVYHGDPTQNTGKTVYQYAVYPDSAVVSTGAYWNGAKAVPVTWKSGEPVSESHYRNIGTNSYALVRSISNTFDIIWKRHATGTVIGYSIEPIASPGDSYAFFSNPVVNSNGVFTSSQWEPTEFYWFDYPISTGVRALASTTVTDYDSTGYVPVLAKTTQYYYDDTTLYLPTRTVTTDSKGHTHTLYTYRTLDQAPVNAITPLSTSAISAIDSMVSRNILTPVILQAEYLDSFMTELSLTNYNNWTGTLVAPQNVQTQMVGYPLDTRLQYNRYDANGNPLEVQKTNDVREVYLWGYHGLYPVAKIINSTYAKVSSYVVQSVLDNPPSDAALRSQLSNLRNIPEAMVTIYTYNPLVGMTSQTDPQGKTSYFEYDAFSRLKDIKDKDGNILKTYTYQYRQ